MTDMSEPGAGERLEAQRRRRLWGSVGVLFVAGAISGAVTGYGAASRNLKINEIWASLPQPAVLALVGIALAVFVAGCWRFYRSIDEVELGDNLWASTASYYVYATLFPVWWVLAKANILPQPGGWTIYAIALGGGAIIYIWRKWRAR